MDINQVDDLKQFIAATVSQATYQMASKDDLANVATKDDIIRLETKIDDLASFVSESLDTHSDEIDRQIKDHSIRITRLETNAIRPRS